MTIAIERQEINPHQSLEQLTKNRTFLAYRWKAVRFYDNISDKEADELILKMNLPEGYRAVNWDNGHELISGGKKY